MQSNLFEQLKESDGLYSMKLKGEKNIRILFDFQIVNGKEAAIIYNCFPEKRTKDYSMENKMLVDAYAFFEADSKEDAEKRKLEDILVDIACEFINYRVANTIQL